jgi:hypothetical protein
MTLTAATALRSSMARKGWNIDDAMALDAVAPMPLGPLVFEPTSPCGKGFYTDANGRDIIVYQMAGTYFGQPVLLYATPKNKDAHDKLRRGSHLFARVDARSLGYLTIANRPSMQCFFVPDDALIQDM